MPNVNPTKYRKSPNSVFLLQEIDIRIGHAALKSDKHYEISWSGQPPG